MASIACMAPSIRRRTGGVHRVEKRTSVQRRSRSTRSMSDTGMLAISESMAHLQISGAARVPMDSEANKPCVDRPSVMENLAPGTSQQPTITKLTFQGRVLWTQTTVATVSADLEKMGLHPGKDESIVGDPIPSPPSTAPSSPSYDGPGSGTSTPATTPPSSPGPSPPTSPPTSPGPPPNSPRRRLSINTRYRIPGTQMTVYHRQGKTHIVGSGRTPWIR